MKTYIFDFGDNDDEITLCVEVQADSKADAVVALKTYLDSSPRSDGPYVVPAHDPKGKVQEFRFYFKRETEAITEEHIYDEWD